MKINNTIRKYLNNPTESYIADSQSVLRFDLSHNSDGPNPKIFDVLSNLTEKDFRNYPTKDNLNLKKSYASLLNLKKEQIGIYPGSNLIIEEIARIFLNGEESVLIPIPNFYRFEDVSRRSGAKISHVNT